VLAVLEQAGVESALVRDAGPDAGRTPELDILAVSGPRDALDRALAPYGFLRLPAWGRAPHRFYLGYLEEEGRWLKLDIVTDVAFGRLLEFRLAPAEPFVDRASAVDGVRRLAPDDEFWTLLLHCLLDKKAIRDDHAARLGQLVEGLGLNGPGAGLASSALPPEIGVGGAVELARRHDWAALASGAEPTRRHLARSRPVSVRTRAATNALLRRLSKLQTLLSRRGLRVVLLGPDGAGKSSTAADLEREFPLPARRLYAGLYPAGARPVSSVPGVDLLVRLVRLRAVSARARMHQWRGRLVVFDRYTLDARLPAVTGERARTRLRRWLLGHACPLPDLVIVLDAPGEVLHARSGEHTVEALDAQRRRYLALVGTIPHAVVVDAQAEPEKVVRRVTALVWERYREAWGG